MIFESPYLQDEICETPVGARLLQKLGSYGDRVALVNGDTGKEISFSQIMNDVIEYTATMRSLGVAKGHVIMCFIPLDPDYIALLFAIVNCGAVFMISNNNDQDLPIKIREINPYLVVIHNGRTKPGVDIRVLTLFELRKLGHNHGEVIGKYVFPEVIDVHKDAFGIFHTSGTTGNSKKMVYTHHSMNAAIDQVGGLYLDHTGSELVCFPYFNAIYFVINLKRIYHGVKVVSLTEATVINAYQVIEKYRVTLLTTGNQALIEDFLKNGRVLELNTLKFIQFGGMSFPSNTLQRVRNELSILMTCYYGSSEVMYISSGCSYKCPNNSVGKLVSRTKVRIVDCLSGNSMGINDCGEIWAKNETMIKEYLNTNGKNHLAKDSAGWFHTGDVGYIDERGYLYIIDRIKDIIKGVGGSKIYPSEIEKQLLKHPHVKDIAVIGVKNQKYEEAAKAYVVCGHESADPSDILNFYNQVVPEDKRINGGLEFVDVIPRTESGKIDRNKLRKYHEKNGSDCDANYK